MIPDIFYDWDQLTYLKANSRAKHGRVTFVSAGLIWLEGFKREILALALGEDWNRSFTNFTVFLLIFTNFANTGKHMIEPEAQLLPKDK